jgi:hypothetical protein
MGNMKIPKWVEEQLLEGEEVISKISSGSRLNMVDYYATDKRLLRFSGKTDYEVLEYDKLSIAFTKYGLATGIFRIFSLLFGLFCISLGILTFVGPTFHTGTSTLRTKAPFEVSLLFCGIGFFVILAAIGGRYGYYQIEEQGVDSKELKKWRIGRTRWGGGKVDRFAKVVEERSGRS